VMGFLGNDRVLGPNHPRKYVSPLFSFFSDKFLMMCILNNYKIIAACLYWKLTI